MRTLRSKVQLRKNNRCDSIIWFHGALTLPSFFQLTIQLKELNFDQTHFQNSPAPSSSPPEHPALTAILNWKPISQITQFFNDINYVPTSSEREDLSPDVLKYHNKKGGIEGQDNRQGLEEWCTGVQANHNQNLDDWDEHQETSTVHEVCPKKPLRESVLIYVRVLSNPHFLVPSHTLHVTSIWVRVSGLHQHLKNETVLEKRLSDSWSRPTCFSHCGPA